MGDRVYLSLNIDGHIETIKDLYVISNAIAEENFEECGNTTQVLLRFATCLAELGKCNPFFEMYECNYGQIDEVEAALSDAKVAYSIAHGEGGEFPAGAWAWHPTEGRFEAVEASGDRVIYLTELRTALAKVDPLEEIRTLIRNCEKAGGAEAGSFTVSETVKRHLAKLLADKALGLKEIA